MLIRQLIDRLEDEIDPRLQEDWDNSGLQVGNKDMELRGILLCLDVTEEVIDYAIDKGCNLIISHHPMLFTAMKEIDYSYFKSKKIVKAIKNDIFIYSMHTNMDLAKGGLNEYVFSLLGLDSLGKISYLEDGIHGYGDYGDIEACKAGDLIAKIKKRLQLDHAIFYGDLDSEIKRIGLLTGSGAGFLDDVLACDIDLYISGDIKHHDAMDAIEQGLCLLDIGHHGSEIFFIDLMEKKLREMGCKDIHKIVTDQKYLRKIV